MSKRNLIVVIVALLVALVLSACGSNRLAKDLTPIPTLPAGQTPTLIAALQSGAATEAAPTSEAGGTEAAGTEAAGAGEGAATEAAGEGQQGGQQGDPAAGEAIFSETCSGCHGEENGAGPARVGMSERAPVHAEDHGQGQSPAEYLHESIVNPSAYIVEGFQDIMPKNYGEQFSDEQINNIVAYLLTQ